MPPQCCGGYNGGPDRAYNQFYAAVSKSRQFELVSAPSEADLILEIRFKEPYVWLQDKYSSDPQLRLVVRDPKTNVVLWALTEHIAAALLQGNRDKNFDQALDDLANRPAALRAGRVP